MAADTGTFILTNATLATCKAGEGYGLVTEGGVAVAEGKIVWAGKVHEIPTEFAGFARHDIAGRLVTPGLVDCHTHVIFGGNRAREFEMRLNGASYEEIARAGGGILSTVSATRSASVETLLEQALPRVDALLAEGVTTIEIKSGYGLTVESELSMLRAARLVERSRRVRVITTFLGAHATPPEYKGRNDDYITDVVLPAMSSAKAEGLADAVDGFCEGIAFTPAQMRRVFDHASKLGLPVKLHAEQLSDQGGAKLAAEYKALSADHLEYLGQDGIDAMAKSGTVAVMLPGAFYTLRETRLPPIDALRKAGVPMAVATDCNPGTSPMTSLLLAMNMACTLFRMTPEEALLGVTRHAAKALGLKDCGTITPGYAADLCIWDVAHPAELSYRIGFNPLHKRIFKGEWS